ncbi:GHMP family kinase ATP-binding protein [Blattabacterium cuenoti]|uniref:mevalonate kinase n=1 Tax=Blattabacterium cuenoti STAT TaxID=1457030 RepID=A0A224AKX7_9FLAO|nr:mevalonate kinase [Blattabacterium cuenoti]BBA17458.1 mevalonate kinase [Blattabacterium cuenoti STAT]
MKKSFFSAKVLLFGEYGILKNSSGLSIPYNIYNGTLKIHSEFNRDILYSNYEIKKFYNFLSILEKKKINSIKLDLNKLSQDIQKGMFFYSNIPIGYGLGSSGALVAAIYDKYKKDKLKGCLKNNILILKKIFSQMESFFHGKSSGIDPLICYLNKPLLIRSKTDISIIRIPKKDQGKRAVFLLNSETPSKTNFMIQFFFRKLKQDKFKKIFFIEFMNYNEKCIKFFLKEDFDKFLKNVKSLSTWVLKHFRPMISDKLLKIWENGLFNNIYYLKLCGSGGGGFFLGFTPNYDLSRKELKKYAIEVLFRF